MAITLLHHEANNIGNGTAAPTRTLSWTPTAGNFLLVGVAVDFPDANQTITSVTDNAGNTYSPGTNVENNTQGSSCRFFWVPSCTGTLPTLTVNLSESGVNHVEVYASEWSGIDNSSPLDVQNTATGTTSPLSVASLTTTNSNDLVVGLFEDNQGTALSTSGAWNTLDSSSIPNSLINYQIVSSAASWIPTATESTPNNWACAAISFKAAAAASGGLGGPQHAGLYDGPDGLTKSALFAAESTPVAWFDEELIFLNDVSIRQKWVSEFDGEADSYYAKDQFTLDSGLRLASWFDDSIVIPDFQVSNRIGESDPDLYVPSVFAEEMDVLSWWDAGLPPDSTALASGITAVSAENNPAATGDGNVTVSGLTAASAENAPIGVPYGLPAGISAASAENNPLGVPSGLPAGQSAASAENAPIGVGIGVGSAQTAASAGNNLLGVPAGVPAGLSAASAENNPTATGDGLASPAGIAATSAEHDPIGVPYGLPSGVAASAAEHDPLGSVVGVTTGQSAAGAEANPIGVGIGQPAGLSLVATEHDPEGDDVAFPQGQTAASAEHDGIGAPSGLPAGIAAASAESNPLGSVAGVISGQSAASAESNATGASVGIASGLNLIAAEHDPTANGGGAQDGTALPAGLSLVAVEHNPTIAISSAEIGAGKPPKRSNRTYPRTPFPVSTVFAPAISISAVARPAGLSASIAMSRTIACSGTALAFPFGLTAVSSTNNPSGYGVIDISDEDLILLLSA